MRAGVRPTGAGAGVAAVASTVLSSVNAKAYNSSANYVLVCKPTWEACKYDVCRGRGTPQKQMK